MILDLANTDIIVIWKQQQLSENDSHLGDYSLLSYAIRSWGKIVT